MKTIENMLETAFLVHREKMLISERSMLRHILIVEAMAFPVLFIIVLMAHARHWFEVTFAFAVSFIFSFSWFEFRRVTKTLIETRVRRFQLEESE